MYTTTSATREQALVAIATIQRAMDRHVCCKSQYKFKCFSCGKMIHRGHKITRGTTSRKDGVDLRFRGADSRNGITFEETSFYLAQTGSRKWVHIGCNPCYWDRDAGRLIGVFTDWGAKISHEFEEWRSLTNHYDMEEFLEKHGYPQDKWMKDRVIAGVTKFQALWRGYIYKQAYPWALKQKKATEAINVEPVTIFNIASQLWYGLNIGDHCEVLFNRGEQKETIYSGEIYEVQYRGEMDTKIKVKYHFDGEVRKYTGKKFKLLKKECEEHKRKLGIEAKLIGRLNTARIGLIGAASGNDLRYHRPDGTPE